MYRFKYTFWDENRFPGFRESISNLYDTCINHYKNTCKKKDFELKMFDTFFNDLENYFRVLITNGIVTQKNFVNILEQLKKLDLVVLLPKSKRNFYGVNFGYQIAINPEIEGMDEYSEDFMKQLVVSHELGHLINNKWVVDTKELSKRLYKDPVVSKTLKSIDAGSYKYIQAGFSLLDEVVAEEAAEEVTYFLYKKKRPKKEIRNISSNIQFV